ncbi:MAG TPA: hypothetical protein VG164_14730 [Trebonia sp.]|nr:hypothetical protein [Trebonia sp.]
MYKRRIAFGGAASAFLVAGIFGTGTAFASTGTTMPSASALISSLPSPHSVPMMVSGNVAPAGRDLVQHLSLRQQSAPAPLAPVAQALPGLGTASGIASTATGVYNSVPGLQSAPNVVSGIGGQNTSLPGVAMGGSSVAKTAQSVTPGQLNGTVSNVGRAAGNLPGGTNLPTVGSVAQSAKTIPGSSAVSQSLGSTVGRVTTPGNDAAGSLSGVTGSLNGVSGIVPGVSSVAGGNGLNGNLPVG